MSEVRLSEVMNNEIGYRLDAEFYQKEYLNEDFNLSKIGTVKLGENAFITDGQHGYYESDEKSNIHMLAARNCKDYFANTTDALLLAKWVDDKNKRSSLQSGDIILSTRGSVGCCAIVYDEVLPANINQDVARIKLNNSALFCPEFLITYLNCKYGQNWMARNQSGMVQQGLPLDKVRAIPLPILSSTFQKQVETLVKNAHKNLLISNRLYQEAEDILLVELHFKDFKPSSEAVSIKRFSDFASSGRLDAEYYRKRYGDLFDKLSKYKCKKLGSIVCVKKSIEPGSEKYQEDGIPFIRVSDISKFEIQKTDLHLSEKEFNLDNLRPHKDTILFSKDGSIGIAYKCDADMDVITSGALLHLDVTDSDVSSDYLTLVLNSAIVGLQAERDCSGAIIQHWKIDDIKNMIIPILPTEAQEKIVEKIKQSMALRIESKELLEMAKRKVEDVIYEMSKENNF